MVKENGEVFLYGEDVDTIEGEGDYMEDVLIR